MKEAADDDDQRTTGRKGIGVLESIRVLQQGVKREGAPGAGMSIPICGGMPRRTPAERTKGGSLFILSLTGLTGFAIYK